MPRAMSGPPVPPSLGQSQAHPDCNLSDILRHEYLLSMCCSAILHVVLLR